MQSENRLFDDMARMAGGALSALTGLKTEVESLVRQQLEHLLGNLQVVTREEFDAVQALAAKARDEQEGLVARLAALEAEVAGLKSAAAAKGAEAAPKPKADADGEKS